MPSQFSKNMLHKKEVKNYMFSFDLDQKEKEKNLHKQVELLFNIWMNLPKGKKHRIDPNSKIYKRVYNYVSNLRQGLPLVSTSGGFAAISYFRCLKLMVNTISNNDKRILNLTHRKWKTKEIVAILTKIGEDIERPVSLDAVFWMPVVRFSLYSDKYSSTGFSYFSLYALNQNTRDEYNNLVDEFYQLPFTREVSPLTRQKEAIILEEYVKAEKASMDMLKKLLCWYSLARDEQYVRKVDTFTQFLKERSRLEANRANLSKSQSSTNKNSYVSEKLRSKLKNIKEFEL